MVPVLDHFMDPVSERIADNSSSHVTDPLLGEAEYLLVVLWIVFEALGMVLEERQDTLDCKGLVLRYVNCCDVLLLDTYFKGLIVLQ